MSKGLIFIIFITFISSPLQGFDGIDFYYGIGIEQDYNRALIEFQKEKYPSTDDLFQILIYLNGDGVTKNINKAHEVLLKKFINVGKVDMTTINLKNIIEERLAHPDSFFQHLTFDDISKTTVDTNEAESIHERILQAQRIELIDKIKKKLKDQEIEYWLKLNQLVETIMNLDSKRIMTQFINGTIRTSYSIEIRRLISSNFINRSKSWLLEETKIKTNENDFKEADTNLNNVYKIILHSLESEYQEFIEMYNDEPRLQEKYRTYTKEMVTGLISSQRKWIAYRDTWVSLILLLYTGPDARNVEFYLKTELTKDRITELEYSNLD